MSNTLNARVMVVSLSGNTGKTSIAKHCLQPRMNCELVSINSERDLASNKAKLEDISTPMIFDVSANIIEMVFERAMLVWLNLEACIDCFVVPICHNKKMQRDAINTMDALIQLGVNPRCIKPIFNNVRLGESDEGSINMLFETAIDFMEQQGIDFNTKAVIYKNEDYFYARDDGREADIPAKAHAFATKNLDMVFDALFNQMTA